MNQLKLSQKQFNELCCAGKLHFENHDVYAIHWITYYKMLACSIHLKKDEYEIIQLIVEIIK